MLTFEWSIDRNCEPRVSA